VTVTTGQLQKDAARLLAWAEDHDIALDRFTARPASLEEAFIRVAGDAGAQRQEDDE
jgi:ABC-2 type transport system ATP-binding protein